MSTRRRNQEGRSPEDSGQPVTSGGGQSRRHHAAWRRSDDGRAPVHASRRDAVLRILMEAYRRDVGPSAADPS